MKAIDFLENANASFRIEEHDQTYTAQRLAEATHTRGANVLKPVVVHAGKKHVMCVIPADHRLDLDKVEKAVGSTQPVRLVPESEFLELFPDAEVGAECPIGELYGMETVMEESMHNKPHDVVFQCGTHKAAVRMPVTEFVRVVSPTLAPISHHV